MDLTPYFGKFTARTTVANTAVTGGRFVAVVADAAGDEAHTAAEMAHGYPQTGHATGQQYGVAMRDRAVGERVGVFVPGAEVPVEVGTTAVAAGDPVEALADGTIVPLGTSATVADNVLAGLAMEAGATGDFIRVLIK